VSGFYPGKNTMIDFTDPFPRKRNQPRRREEEKFTKKKLLNLLRELCVFSSHPCGCTPGVVVDFSSSSLVNFPH
jgi:hypothetical protein